MGVHVSIRGWLECDEQQLAAVRQVIADHSDGHYSDGWGFPARHLNWTSYVFYGGDVRASAVDWFMDQLRAMAAIRASDEDGERVRGLFVASSEVAGQVEWQVRGGSVTTRPTEAGLAYLAE
ncbi:hypothetical protein OG539_12905 [Actinacidiphila glaucinigra]|uniref:hypothetical protein n=1 Tax=Actinacidiphila glaucinigra TaxID=235986 RepID=UPI002DDA3C2B|nr:hypothetical protein [Actinacidiphila glaucinigra]WSD62791.1 hypothetical protein OIE69_29795 [Actinacidiphila glaucinigra]